VIDPHSWSLCRGRRAIARRLLPLLRGGWRAGLDARHLRLLAARTEHRLLQLRVLVLQLGKPIGEIGNNVLQDAVVIQISMRCTDPVFPVDSGHRMIGA
jgi:hypothetical protein